MHVLETSAGLRVRACRYGTMLYNPKDAYVGRSLDLYGEFSEGEVKTLMQLAPEGGVVLDIGANIGAHTVALARKVGPKGVVLAFEPQPRIYMMLLANLLMNGLANVLTYSCALGTEKGTAFLPVLDYERPANYGGVSVADEPDTRVPTRPTRVMALDDLDLAACALMKIDVEGSEAKVLRGGMKTIMALRPILYVENDRQEKSAELVALLRRELGYELYWDKPLLYNPENIAGNAENVFSRIASLNMLCLPRERQRNVTGLIRVDDPA
jgi:FkbM family methyltransferase